MEEPAKQENIRNPDGTFKKGVSGNLAGRPKGKTLKEWRREKLMEMSDDERLEFLKTIPNSEQWRMAEGNPDTKNETTGELKVLLLDKELASLYGIRTAQETDGSSQEPNAVQGS